MGMAWPSRVKMDDTDENSDSLSDSQAVTGMPGKGE